MIDLHIHIKSTPEERENLEEFSNKLHNALRGWDAYINSDVLLNVDDEDETVFLIGPDIERDGKVYGVRVDVNLSDLAYIDGFSEVCGEDHGTSNS